jgi:hypothetical protein
MRQSPALYTGGEDASNGETWGSNVGPTEPFDFGITRGRTIRTIQATENHEMSSPSGADQLR